MKKHAPPFDGSCLNSAPHLSKDERGIITSALSKLVGFGTLPEAGCRGVIGPFPQPLLIRYEIFRDLPTNILPYLLYLSTKSLKNSRKFSKVLFVVRFCAINCLAAIADATACQRMRTMPTKLNLTTTKLNLSYFICNEGPRREAAEALFIKK